MEHPPPTCPRCAYDLSSATAAWEESCPLHGQCWECGLHLAWADVLREDRRVNLRHVEHATGGWEVAGAAWRTWAWAIWPPRFWQRVRLEHHVVPRRLWRWLLLVVGSMWLLHVIFLTLAAGRRVGWNIAFSLRDDVCAEIAQAVLAPVGSLYQKWIAGTAWGYTFAPAWESTHWGPAYVPLLVFTVMFAVMMLVLKDTRARAKVRFPHVLRAGVFGLAWLVPLVAVAIAVEALAQWANSPTRTAWVYVPIGARSFYIPQIAGYALVPPMAAWVAWWWWLALSRGWRIEQPAKVWWTALLAATLAMVIVLVCDNQLISILAG